MEDFTNKIAVVTGGAGFIGSHLVDALLARGATVRVIDNLSTGKRENIAHVLDKIEFTEGSILDSETLARVMQGADYVFHQAAVPSVPKSVKDPETTHEANATGSLKVYIAARDAKVKRVVYAASSSFYGDTPTLPKDETMPANPLSPYALQKYVGERYAWMFYSLYGLETVALRYFNIYGPRQDPHSEYSAVIPLFIASLKKGTPPTIFGDGTTSRDFTFVTDAVQANLLAAVTPGIAGEVFNCAGGRRVSLTELVAELQKQMGTDVTPIHADERVGDIKHSYADCSKAERLMGYKPQVAFEDGLAKTIASVA